MYLAFKAKQTTKIKYKIFFEVTYSKIKYKTYNKIKQIKKN